MNNNRSNATCMFDTDETAVYTFQKPQNVLARRG